MLLVRISGTKELETLFWVSVEKALCWVLLFAEKKSQPAAITAVTASKPIPTIHRFVGVKEVGLAFRSRGASIVAGTELPSMESNRLICSVNKGKCFCNGGVTASNHCTVSRKYARFSRGLTASMRNGITASPKEKALATSRPTC